MSEELDGVVVDPTHHKVLFENDYVRVVETIVPAGDTTPVHTHLAPTLTQVVSFAHFIRRDHDGNVMFDSREKNMPPDIQYLFAESTPQHTIENTDTQSMHVIGVELKQVVK
jgi:hypothetical protein